MKKIKRFVILLFFLFLYAPAFHTNAAVSLGNKRVLVMLINFRNDIRHPVTPNEVSTVLFGTQADSVSNFFKENSFGLRTFTGTAMDWTVIPFDAPTNTTECYQGYPWKAAALATLPTGVANTYDRFIFFMPKMNCPYGAVGVYGGDTIWVSGENSKETYTHELGHNEGFAHSLETTCTSTLQPLNTCTQIIAPVDRMGSNNYFQFNAPSKAVAGWIAPGNVKNVSTAGTFLLTPMELSSSGTQLIKIPITGTSDYYFISYRQPIGFDSTLPPSTTRGVTIQRWDENPQHDLHTIRISQESSEVGDGLIDNGFFFDRDNHIYIEQISHNTQGATIRISHSLPSDLDADNDVDIFDYNLLVSHFGQRGTNLIGDIQPENAPDGDVDIFDYNLLVSNLGR